MVVGENGRVASRRTFVVARNRDAESRLPYLLAIPVEGGLLLARESWPRAARVYCHPLSEGWPEQAEIVERVPVKLCRRRGPAIDLPRLSRSQFVFTEVRGRPAISGRRRRRRAAPTRGRAFRVDARSRSLTILVDTRERYPYRFSGRPVERNGRPCLRATTRSGAPGTCLPQWNADARGLRHELVRRDVVFPVQRLGDAPLAAVVAEGGYSELFRLQHVEPVWIADVLSRLHARYAEIQVTFPDSRMFAEEWSYRFLASAAADADLGARGAEDVVPRDRPGGGAAPRLD